MKRYTPADKRAEKGDNILRPLGVKLPSITREKAQQIADELQAVLVRHGVSLGAEGGMGPIELYAGIEPLRLEVQADPFFAVVAK